MYKGLLWDVDLILTSRSQMVPNIIRFMHKINSAVKAGGLKPVYCIEDMPILSYKGFVAQTAPEFEDLQTLTGYYASEKTFFVNFWERDQTIKLSKQWLAGAKVRELQKKCVYANPMLIKDMLLKSKESLTKIVEQVIPFTVAYTQRYEKAHRRSEDILEIMQKQWIYNGGQQKMRFLLTTNARGVANSDVMRDTNFIEFYRAPREEFHRMIKEDMCVVLVLAPEDGYSFSCLEPLIFGTPVIVLKAPYSIAMLGENYPFFVDNDMQAYGLVKQFFDDYIGMYKKFANWQQNEFRSMMLSRNDMFLPFLIENELEEYKNRTIAYGNRRREEKTHWNSITETLLEDAPDEFHLVERFTDLRKSGKFKAGLNLTSKHAEARQRITFDYVEPHHMKVELRCHGYEDASIEVGHIRKVT
jgi:hypothetical protein